MPNVDFQKLDFPENQIFRIFHAKRTSGSCSWHRKPLEMMFTQKNRKFQNFWKKNTCEAGPYSRRAIGSPKIILFPNWNTDYSTFEKIIRLYRSKNGIFSKEQKKGPDHRGARGRGCPPPPPSLMSFFQNFSSSWLILSGEAAQKSQGGVRCFFQILIQI